MYGVAKWKIIAWVFVSFLVVICTFMGALASVAGDPLFDVEFWLYSVISALIFTTSQIIFIIPMAKPPKLSTKGRSLRLQMLIAGLLGTILTVILAMMVASVITTLILNKGDEDEWGYALVIFSGVWIFEGNSPDLDDLNDPIFLGHLGFIVITWCIWSYLLWKRIKLSKHDPSVLSTFTGKLFAGSLVELILSIPLIVMVQRRADCYCATGSFGALIMSVMASLWLFGPFIFIVLFWRKRPWTRTHCFTCGYPRKIANATVCSECGGVFK